MKRALIIFGLCSLLNTTETYCQVPTNSYEVAFDQLFAAEAPSYYKGLQTILYEFQEELVSKGLLKNDSYESYWKLLKEVRDDGKIRIEPEFDLDAKVQQLGNGIEKVYLSTKSSVISRKYLNTEHSKDYVFMQQLTELAREGVKVDRPKYVELMMKVYNYEDFKLPLIKLRLMRCIDPKTELNFVVYLGKPTQN